MNCTKKSYSWIATEERMPNVHSGKFRVRLKNGNEVDAYFYQDAMSWISFYGQKTSHFWQAHGYKEKLDDVTHWSERSTD